MREHFDKLFFLPAENIEKEKAVIKGSDYNHIVNVLRYKIGDSFCVLTSGGKYIAKITAIKKDSVNISLDEFIESGFESKYKINLIQGIPKGSKFDLVIEKATEMGVFSIQPLITSRTEINNPDKVSRLRIDRWKRIAIESSKQCKRSIVPEVKDIIEFDKLITSLRGTNSLKIIFWELEKNNYLNNILDKNNINDDIDILIGPEGGFPISEVNLAIDCGFKPCSLGNYILRTETAGFFSVGLINYLLLEMNL